MRATISTCIGFPASPQGGSSDPIPTGLDRFWVCLSYLVSVRDCGIYKYEGELFSWFYWSFVYVLYDDARRLAVVLGGWAED